MIKIIKKKIQYFTNLIKIIKKNKTKFDKNN